MRSLRFKFFVFISALMLILILLLNTYPVISSRDLVFEEKQNSLSSQAAVIASALSSLDRLSYESIKEVLNVLDISGYENIIVVDFAGQTKYNDVGRALDADGLELIQRALSGKTVFSSSFADGAFASEYAMPIVNQLGPTGVVYINEYDSERAEIILDMQSRMLRISLGVLTAALLLAYVFSQLIVNRLRSLVKSMRIVATGDYSHRFETRGSDEVAQLGEEFNNLTRQLDTNEKQRRRFVADASHELKTPLASITLLSDSIVQNEMDRETTLEFVTDIGHEAERLRRTTEKLLDLSRLDDGVQIVPEPVDLKQVALDSLALLRPLASEKDVHIRCNLPDGCVIMATADDMFHVIFNLLENAVKYNVPGGSVELSLEADESTVRLSVADTGIGIPEEDRLNIFSRFYRVDKARSREAGGSGLGLSIVHDTVLRHGGTIAVGQNKPCGSVFIVRFPRPTSEETGI